MPALRCSVIIPARDEAGAIADVVRRVRRTLDAEVIVVDNNSTDGTAEIARAAGARVVAETVRGYGHACLAGIRAAAGPDIIVLLDGDGSMSPEEIPSLLQPIAANAADVVCGSRVARATAGSMPAHQAFGNWLAVTLLHLLYGVRLTDLGPFRAVRASTLASLQMRPSRFAFLAEMLARAARRGARIVEVEVGYRARIAGQSKVGGSVRGSLEAGTEIIASLIANRIDDWAAWSLGIGASVAFFLLAWLRHASLRSTAYDLGFFDQVVWNASHGHGLASSFLDYSFFGQHFEPALLLFVPLYVLHGTPLWLLLGQSLALGLASVPLFALARGWLGRQLAWVVVGTYLVQLGVSRTVAFDFHTEALSVPFVFLALLALRDRHRTLFLIAGTAPMLCKEDGALVTVALGLVALLVMRDRIALLLSAAGLVSGGVVLLAVMPAFRHGLPGDLIGRYAYLGSSPRDIVLHLFTEPGIAASHLLNSGALPAVGLALLGVGLLPLLRPGLLLIALIPLTPSLLSGDPDQARLMLHYGIDGIPLLLLAAMLGLHRLQPSARSVAIGTVALAAGGLGVFIALSPLPRMVLADVPDLFGPAGAVSVLRHIPADAPVAASTALVPHLSERNTIDELPCGAGQTAWVAVLADRRPSAQSLQHGYAPTIANLPRLGYRPVATNGAITVWSAPGGEAQAPASCFPSR
ncbi:MAG: DUF2079 domain-containing protein [Candidatus Dormibacteraeota bacterium]|nr:DUF2079 domain-containing protein [Candidatus Dormibacteraeota bacterium]